LIDTLLAPLKFVGGPGSIGFLLVTLALGFFVMRVWPPRPRLGRTFVISVAVLYLVLATPVVSQRIAGWLPETSEVDAAALRGIDTLVVFDGDNRRGRLREGLRIWATAKPRLLVVSGAAWLEEQLLESGVAPDRLKRDESAATTRQQIEWIARRASEHPGERLAVVASWMQMPRVEALARVAGLTTVTFVPSRSDIEPARAGWRTWVPSYAALRVSRDALYEIAALEFYERRGWI
jgi:uncharacterized SAM-binding protein YcdF (DUF218 family)